MEAKQSNIRCFGCKCFRAYYSITFCSLFRERFGYCEIHNKIQDNDYCDKWRRRPTSSSQRTGLTIKSINEIHEKISNVEQMLKEGIEITKLDKDIKD